MPGGAFGLDALHGKNMSQNRPFVFSIDGSLNSMITHTRLPESASVFNTQQFIKQNKYG